MGFGFIIYPRDRYGLNLGGGEGKHYITSDMYSECAPKKQRFPLI